MDYNYHTHTYHCHHAGGKPEEYVKRAISGGIKYMGFSDHSPFVCANGCESLYRVSTAEAKEYCEEIRALAEKYKNDIDIKIGFEMEYYPEDFEKMLSSAVNYGAEYLILGAHFLGDESVYPEHTLSGTDSFGKLQKYVSTVVRAIKSGIYTYVAHPDIFLFNGDKEQYKNEMRKICVASREYGVPLEINFLGIRTDRSYPDMLFWEIAGEEKSPVTFGLDAHEANDAYDSESLIKAQKIVENYKLNYIGRPEIVLIKEKI